MERNDALTEQELRRRERFINKSAALASKYLRRAEQLSGMPEGLRPFLDALHRIFIDFEDVEKPEGWCSVGTYCVMVPQELLYAVHAVDIKLCSGSAVAFLIGDQFMPRDSCPVVKAAAGAKELAGLPLYDNLALSVVPITCDCKKKFSGELGADRPVHTIRIPRIQDIDACAEAFTDELYAMLRVLEQHCGRQITYDRLLEGVDHIGRAQYEFSRFYRLRQAAAAPLRGTFSMLVMNALACMPVDSWTAALAKLNRELEERIAGGYTMTKKRQPRILLTGSPVMFPNIKVPLLIDELGGTVVCDETCMGDRFLYDPLVISDPSFDGVMRALADRYLRPCTCPVFPNNGKRVYRLLQMISDFRADAVIYHVLRGCLTYDYEYRAVEEALAARGIPVIRLESDYSEEDVEQLRIRIEAFIEMVKYRK